jgi:hypothetical protein
VVVCSWVFYRPEDAFRLYPEYDVTSPSLECTFAVDSGKPEVDDDASLAVDESEFPLFHSADVWCRFRGPGRSPCFQNELPTLLFSAAEIRV